MQKLTDQDCYRTPADKRCSLLARLCPWVDAAFYLPVAVIVIRAGIRASLGRYDGRRWVESSLGIVRAMEAVGMRLTVEGMNHFRSLEGPVVFVGNHMSTLETFVLPCIIHPVVPVTFVVKESLLRYPVFGPVMRSRDPVVVGRQNPRQDLVTVMNGGMERLARGESIIVFPQTTRTPVFDPSQFNTIGVKLAARAGVPVVPLALKTDAWGNGKRVKEFGPVNPSRPVHFRFGEAIAPEGKGNRAQEITVEFIQQSLAEWAQK